MHDSPPVRLASCMSGTRARPSSTGCWRTARMGRSCSASKTPTPSARRVNQSRASSKRSRWLGLDWDEGPDVGGPTALSPVGAAASLRVMPTSSSRAITRTTAFACRTSSTPIARPISRPANRRNTTAPAVRYRAKSRVTDRGRRAASPLSSAGVGRGQVLRIWCAARSSSTRASSAIR